MRKGILAFFLILAVAGSAAAENMEIGFQSADTGSGARARGLAGAFVAVPGDATSAYWNPAGLYSVRERAVAATYSKWVLDASMQYLEAAFPIGQGAMSATLNYIYMGEFTDIDENGYLTGRTINPYSLAIAAAYGAKVYDAYADINSTVPSSSLSLGVGLKYIVESLDGDANNAVLMDAGLIVDITDILQAGISISNINLASEVQAPTNLNAGLAKRIRVGQFDSFLITGGFKYYVAGDKKFSAGAEYSFGSAFFLRAGYEYNPGLSTAEGTINGLCGGFGMHYDRFKVDYAMTTNGSLGINHTVTITLLF